MKPRIVIFTLVLTLIAAVCFVTHNAYSHSLAVSGLSQDSAKPKWVKFDGTAEKTEGNYKLLSKNDKGEIQAPADAVQIKGTEVYLKAGSIVKVVHSPEPGKKHTSKGCRQTQCVGLVLICCDDGHVISACIGAWGC